MIERYAQFLFLKKGLKLLHHILCIIFLKKIFLLYSIIWLNFIVRLLLLLEISSNMCIAIDIQFVTYKFWKLP